MPWPENNKANDILTPKKKNVYSSRLMQSPQRTPVASRIDALFGVCNAEVKCREASSHERHASRQVKWIKHTNDRSTLLCNIRPLHRRRIHNDSTNERWCVLASCQSKQNWRAHPRTFSRERIPPCLFFPSGMATLIQVRTCHDLHIFFSLKRSWAFLL